MNIALRLFSILGLFSSSCFAQEGGGWRIVFGNGPLEARAAEYLYAHWGETWEEGFRAPVSVEEWDGQGPVIHIGTPATHSLIAAEHRARPFQLMPQAAESYHLVFREEGQGVLNLWSAGSDSKGAMNGVFRLMDHGLKKAQNFDEALAPAFGFRVGGHKINQSPPPEWSEEDQAAFYARNYLNVVWGEKHGPPMTYEARQHYGLGLKVELRFPPRGEDWMQQKENRAAVYHRSATNAHPVISPFHPRGRDAYVAGFEGIFRENPDVKILYGIFGDYNAVPNEKSVRANDGEPYPYTEAETIREVLGIMREVAGAREALVVFWPWHSFWGDKEQEARFMKEVADAGFGVLYNEAGDNDNWIFKRDNFNEVAVMTDETGRTAFGDNYMSLVSAGGSCESMNPVIAYPLPHVAAYKLHRLASIGTRHFSLWWGSGEGWAYSANLSVIREMIWEPELFEPGNKDPFDIEKGDPLLRRVAVRDFGEELAPDILEFWRLLDEALVTEVPEYLSPGSEGRPPPDESGLHIYDWFQRIGTYTEAVFNAEFPLPITPATMADEERFKLMVNWGAHPITVENYCIVLERLRLGGEKIGAIRRMPMPEKVRTRVDDMANWSGLFYHLLRAQYNHLRALLLMRELKGEAVDSPTVRERILPIVKDDMENNRQLIDLIGNFASNFNLSLMHRGVVGNIGDRNLEIRMLAGKNSAMKSWITGRRNIALGADVAVSSSQGPERAPELAVDGRESTLWHSERTDREWIRLDLGEARTIDGIQLHWKFAYPKFLDIAVAESSDGPWDTIVPRAEGYDGVMAIELEKKVKARFIRVRGLERGTPEMGYALTQFIVYGE